MILINTEKNSSNLLETQVLFVWNRLWSHPQRIKVEFCEKGCWKPKQAEQP